jgi:hypothetical protein
MHSRRIALIPMSLGAFGCFLLVAGCGDDSRTTGTQLQISPAVKAEINDMKSAQKEIMAERRANAAKKGKR